MRRVDMYSHNSDLDEVSVLQGGLSAVFVACDKGHIEVLKILVKAGADVNQAAAMVRSNCNVMW